MRRVGKYLVAAVATPFILVGVTLAIGFGLAMSLVWGEED